MSVEESGDAVQAVDVSVSRWDIVRMNLAIAPKLTSTWVLFVIFCGFIVGS